MKITVTGGAGFIGSHIVEHYHRSADVTVLDTLRTGYKKNLEGLNCNFIQGSVLDKSCVEKAVEGADYVFHLAAMINVPESVQKPHDCIRLNTDGTLNVLEASAAAGVRKLCFSSSSAIYGDSPEIPKTEDMLPQPKSPYAISKLDGEYYCKFFNEETSLNTACLRYFNVFGPRQDPTSAYAAVIPAFINKAVKNEPLVIYGDGEQTRDFVYVKDITAANAFMAENDCSGVYNAAYGETTAINKLAETIIDMTGSSSEIKYQSERPGDIRHSTASINRILSTGFQFTSDFKDGLKKTVEHFSALT